MNLRFIMRNGKKVLQYGELVPIFHTEKVEDSIVSGLRYNKFIDRTYEMQWFDIPLIDEETGEEIEENE